MEGLRVVKLEKVAERQDLGIKAGDVLVALDDDKLKSHESLKQSIDRLLENGEESATIEYLRNRERFNVSVDISKPFGLVLQPIVLEVEGRNLTASASNSASLGSAASPPVPMVSFILFVLAFLIVVIGFALYLTDVNNPFAQLGILSALISAIFWIALGTIIRYLADIRHYLRLKEDP